MFELIDVYVKRDNRWEYVEGSRMSKTLVAAKKRFSDFSGVPLDKIKTVYAEPKVKQKPAPRSSRISRTNMTIQQYLDRPPQITRKAPTNRAKARRATHLAAGLPPGYYPNPLSAARLAIGFNAGNDRSGNPRAGWLVCEIIRSGSPDASVKILEWVDKGYRGNANLYSRYPDIPGIGEFSLSAAVLKAYQKLYRVDFRIEK